MYEIADRNPTSSVICYLITSYIMHFLYWLITTCQSTQIPMPDDPMVPTVSTPGHSYFNTVPHLWNTLPVINLNYSTGTIKN